MAPAADGDAAGAFMTEGERAEPPVDVKAPHAKIAQRTLELGFSIQRPGTRPQSDRTAMIDRTQKQPSIERQARLPGLSRVSVYCKPRPVSETTLDLTRRIDELHLELPFTGSRMLRDLLNADGISLGHEHVRTLMRRICITAIYQRPKTTRRHRTHPVFPYSLRTLTVTRLNHV
jgi:putative transposase